MTDPKTTEEALRIAEGKYRRLVESLERDYILYSHDTEGNFTYLSPSIKNVLGYTPEEFMGHYAEFITDNPINEKAMEHTMATLRGEKQEPYVAEYFHQNGSRVLIRNTEVPAFDANGKVIGVEGIVQDITEQRRAEAEREELIQKLETALRKVNTLSGFLPICAKCKKIRGEDNAWHPVETYVKKHSNADFSYRLCPECHQRELEGN